MHSFIMQSIHNERSCFFIAAMLLLVYILIMDIILFCSLQNSTLVDPVKEKAVYSPFHPLSIKLLLSDPIQHYVINPTSEYFDEFTNFSKNFFFITPNMITFTHLGCAFIAAKLVSSESLYYRRLGIIVFEFRSWLDSLDGVVFRSHQNQKHTYRSIHNSWGYLIDSTCDIAGGVLLSFGVLFYLFKMPPSFFQKHKDDCSAALPLTKSENGYMEKTSVKPSKKMIFFKCFCWGMQIFFSSGTWDKRVEQYSNIFAKKISDAKQTELQTETLHSLGTWVVFYLWRYIDGQALLQVFCIAVFLDKVWEFLNFVQYLGFGIVIIVNVLSEVHYRHVKAYIGL